MGQFSFTHLLLIAVIFLLFFGPSRLPQLGQSLGRAIKGFKEGLNGDEEETKPVGSRHVNAQEQLRSTSSQDSLHQQSNQNEKKNNPHS